jgi:hypothetical protein
MFEYYLPKKVTKWVTGHIPSKHFCGILSPHWRLPKRQSSGKLKTAPKTSIGLGLK